MKFRTRPKIKIGGIYEVDTKPFDGEKYNYKGKVRVLYLGKARGTGQHLPENQRCFWHSCKILGKHTYSELKIAECFFIKEVK